MTRCLSQIGSAVEPRLQPAKRRCAYRARERRIGAFVAERERLCAVDDVDEIIIRKATSENAEAACSVLVRSIKEICAPYYENDEAILAQWLENKTPTNVRRWIESDGS